MKLFAMKNPRHLKCINLDGRLLGEGLEMATSFLFIFDIEAGFISYLICFVAVFVLIALNRCGLK
jgi:hypothetical protein